MNKFLLLTGICLLLTSCKITSPTFKNLGQWQVSNISTSNITLSNTAYFYNPNNIDGIKLNSIGIDVLANGRKLGTIVNPNGKVVIPKNADFSIPLSLNVNPQDLISGLGSILGAALGNSIDVQCKGNVNLGYMMINKSIHVDQTLPVKLNGILK